MNIPSSIPSITPRPEPTKSWTRTPLGQMTSFGTPIRLPSPRPSSMQETSVLDRFTRTTTRSLMRVRVLNILNLTINWRVLLALMKPIGGLSLRGCWLMFSDRFQRSLRCGILMMDVYYRLIACWQYILEEFRVSSPRFHYLLTVLHQSIEKNKSM